MDNSVFEEANAEMSRRRQNAISESERRVSEINRKLPQIKEINETLYRTGRELIGMIAGAKGADVSARIEELKKSNLGAQEMCRNILVQNGYPADYLEVQYICKECSDTGYTNGRICGCFRKLCGKIASEKLNRKTCLTLCDFSSFELSYYDTGSFPQMKRIFDHCRDFAANFPENYENLLMMGKTGLGKTHLSLAIAKAILEKGYNVIYDSAVNLLGSIEEQHFGRERSSEMLELVMDCDLLILDDLGTEYESQFFKSTVYNIVNTRLNRRKATIISTNLDLNAINRRYDERMASRLMTMYTCLGFTGEDVRLLKKAQGV